MPDSDTDTNLSVMDTKFKKDALHHEDNSNKSNKGTTTNVTWLQWDPSRPFVGLEKVDLENIEEVVRLRYLLMAKSVPNDIIIPDPTPKSVRDGFYDIAPRLGIILRKDSVPCFLRLFRKFSRIMSWEFNITSHTLTYIVMNDALRCAKVVLEGKATALGCRHANPNIMNPYGYFPLHEAAERFSVDMIKLLFRHGASANVRTAGDAVIGNLLPLHIAVENACMHKYLEDNLSPIQYQSDYIYKLIYLLCLPEMKIFLDAIRLLAEKTDNLVDELWIYIKEGKLVHSAALLLAAQKKIHGCCTSKGVDRGRLDGFNIIMCRIFRHFWSVGWVKDDNGGWVKDDNGEAQKQMMKAAFQLVSIIYKAGEALDKYVQANSEVPHIEVLEHVSSILMEFGFSPDRECIDVKNLRPYNCKSNVGELHHKGHVDMVDMETSGLRAAEEKALRTSRGWDPSYIRRSFFPFWRSVLVARSSVRVYPSYAPENEKLCLKQLHDPRSNSKSNGPSLFFNHKIGPFGRYQQSTSTHLSRGYNTATLKMLANMLRKA